MEQEEDYIGRVDDSRKGEEEVNDPYNEDATITIILSKKVPIEEVFPQEGDICIPPYLVKQVMNLHYSRDFFENHDVNGDDFLNLRTNFF